MSCHVKMIVDTYQMENCLVTVLSRGFTVLNVMLRVTILVIECATKRFIALCILCHAASAMFNTCSRGRTSSWGRGLGEGTGERELCIVV